jgi:hypothetical protein
MYPYEVATFFRYLGMLLDGILNVLPIQMVIFLGVNSGHSHSPMNWIRGFSPTDLIARAYHIYTHTYKYLNTYM